MRAIHHSVRFNRGSYYFSFSLKELPKSWRPENDRLSVELTPTGYILQPDPDGYYLHPKRRYLRVMVPQGDPRCRAPELFSKQDYRFEFIIRPDGSVLIPVGENHLSLIPLCNGLYRPSHKKVNIRSHSRRSKTPLAPLAPPPAETPAGILPSRDLRILQGHDTEVPRNPQGDQDTPTATPPVARPVVHQTVVEHYTTDNWVFGAAGLLLGLLFGYLVGAVWG